MLQSTTVKTTFLLRVCFLLSHATKRVEKKLNYPTNQRSAQLLRFFLTMVTINNITVLEMVFDNNKVYQIYELLCVVIVKIGELFMLYKTYYSLFFPRNTIPLSPIP